MKSNKIILYILIWMVVKNQNETFVHKTWYILHFTLKKKLINCMYKLIQILASY